VARAVRPEGEAASALGRGLGTLELEIDDHERRAIERSLVALRSRLIEKVGDTTLTPARRRAGLSELSTIASALRKLVETSTGCVSKSCSIRDDLRLTKPQ
jgi:hypothetical protein